GPLDGYSYAYLPENSDFTVEKVEKYTTPFNDLGEKYKYDSYINEITAREVVVGYEDGCFKPDKELTRAEMATIFTRMFSVPKTRSASCFEDIPENHWAKEYIMALVDKGVFMKDTNFNPDSVITREQLIAMTFRMLSDMGKIEPQENETDFSKYKDMDKVSDYAKVAYKALTQENYHLLVELVDHEFMDTADDELFWCPQQAVTRVECCEFLYQFIRTFFNNHAPAILLETAPQVEIPVLDGSTSTYAITQNIYSAYYRNYDNHPNFPKAHSKTVASYKRLIDGEVEMIFVPDAGEEVLKYAEEKNVKLKFIPIADEALIFFTGTKNKVDNITTEQLHDIYVNNGITNWKELGGDDGTLAAYCRNEDSGSHAQMEQFVLAGEEINEDISRERTSIMMSSILTEVDDYNQKNEGNYANYAMGYSLFYYYLVNSSVLGPLDLKFLSIDGIAPTEETISDGTYPYTTSYYAVIRDGENNPKVDAFAELMQGEFGQLIAAQSGLGVKRAY
ncbi:MAG: S-layer homology domain-containing protein, partial [Clostridia bacterium]|nr:S-layer homology domain-containing protein [Clostridia bacterium]